MPHVADGILHAYLDGALPALAEAGALPAGASPDDIELHLRTCSDCRARLDRERGIHEGARLVLQNAAPPPVEVPAFEDLLQPQSPTRRRTRWLPVSWAASVLLATGAGWWGSEVWRENFAARATAERMADTAAAASGERPTVEPAAAAASPAPAEGAATGAAGGTAVQPGQSASARAAEAPVAAEPLAAPSTAHADPPSTTPVTVRAAAVPVADALAAAATDTSDDPSGSAADVAAVPSRPAAIPVGPLNVVVTGEARSPAPPLGESARAERPVAPLPSARTEPAGLARMQAAGLPEGPPAAPGAVLRQPDRTEIVPTQTDQTDPAPDPFRRALQLARQGRLEWTRFAPVVAAAAPGPKVLVVEGGGDPVIDVAAGLAPALVRVRQQVDGRDIELLVWTVQVAGPADALALDEVRRAARAAPDPAAAEAAPTGTMVVVVSSGELPDGTYELIVRDRAATTFTALRGDIPPAALERLAARLILRR